MRHKTKITSVLVTAAVLLVMVGATPGAAAAEPSLTEILQHHDLAVFEWNRLSQVNTTVTDARLDTLQGDGFKTIYVDISEYVEVADQRASRTQQARLAQLNGELKRFVARARSHDLGVHAVAGAPNWTSQSRRYLGPMTLDLVVAYNKTAGDDQLHGIQIDIEPYVDPAWWKNVKPPSRPTSRRSEPSWTATTRWWSRPTPTACSWVSPSPSGTTGHPRWRRSSSAPRTSPPRPPSTSSTCWVPTPGPTSW
jgi:hypothetical protein